MGPAEFPYRVRSLHVLVLFLPSSLDITLQWLIRHSKSNRRWVPRTWRLSTFTGKKPTIPSACVLHTRGGGAYWRKILIFVNFRGLFNVPHQFVASVRRLPIRIHNISSFLVLFLSFVYFHHFREAMRTYSLFSSLFNTTDYGISIINSYTAKRLSWNSGKPHGQNAHSIENRKQNLPLRLAMGTPLFQLRDFALWLFLI